MQYMYYGLDEREEHFCGELIELMEEIKPIHDTWGTAVYVHQKTKQWKFLNPDKPMHIGFVTECPYCYAPLSSEKQNEMIKLAYQKETAIHMSRFAQVGIQGDNILTKEVDRFSAAMMERLAANSTRTSYLLTDINYLTRRLNEELYDLIIAIAQHRTKNEVKNEAVDVANFAMMITEYYDKH